MAENPIVAANDRFAAKLFGELTREQPNANVFFSPLSITLALMLAHAGSGGETEQAIEDTLGLGRISRERAAREAAALVAQLAALDNQAAQHTGALGETEDTVWLRVANALFVNQHVALKPDYATTVREQFQSYVEALDFTKPSAAPTIDGWVRDQTGGKITDIAGKLDSDTLAVLLNAIYFKAPWQNPFNEQATSEEPWTLLDGNTLPVPMMSNNERMLYGRAANYQVVGLPFRGDGDLRFIVVLPERGANFAAFVQTVAQPNFFAQLSLRPTRVRLRMPRFRVECDMQLNEPLIRLGLGVAFDRRRADFHNMLESRVPFGISEVRHKTFVDVNEKGVEAAAATMIKMMRMSMVVEQPVEVVVDRPFVCAIQEYKTGALLFLGAIVRPI